MMQIRNNKDLLTLKIFGFSNMKIIFILALTSFILGWFILFFANPLTASMSKYYEKTKSNYSRDIDHLVTFNKNGLWIREKLDDKQRIISAKKPSGNNLIDVSIFHIDEDSNLLEKFISKSVNIKNNEWILNEVSLIKFNKGVVVEKKFEIYKMNSNYNYEKINNLFKNFDTMSFLDLIYKYNFLSQNGYSKNFLTQSLHSLFALPFFLMLMTGIASIFTMNNLKKSNNFKLIILGLVTCIITYYFKDLSLALGQTGRIPLVLSIWTPVIALSFFIFIGVLQINEK